MLAALVAFALLIANPSGVPALRDLTGQLRVGCGFDAGMSAPLVCRGAQPVGVYLDDSTPNLDYWVARARARWGYVLVARPPGRWGCPWEGVRCAVEVYPFDCRRRWPVLRAARYIVQFRFAWPGCRAPSLGEAVGLVLRVIRFRPWLVLVY